jgi:hypothetical protein
VVFLSKNTESVRSVFKIGRMSVACGQLNWCCQKQVFVLRIARTMSLGPSCFCPSEKVATEVPPGAMLGDASESRIQLAIQWLERLVMS